MAKQLTLDEVADKIKSLISRSALAKIEIGELLNEHVKSIEHGEKENFYKSIGMSERTAQHYMKIASNEKIQDLKAKGELNGLNMSRILELVGMRVNVRGDNNKNAPENEYKPVSLDKFDWNKCKSTRVFKAQYSVAIEKINELGKELDRYKSKSA